jgi:hypothetical protein
MRPERLMTQITTDLRQELERAAREMETSISHIMRIALRDWAARRKSKKSAAGKDNT